ncbi:MAG: Crp/Fnr family transcriptional regulator [Sandaracinaceae bacterium]|nr:Crp/Fnr family transcriptional regulator [Sandaracinaceae bacterium]
MGDEVISLPIIRAACPDCPPARVGCLTEWVGATKHECAFDTGALEARAALPMGWARDYAFGLVRRGVVVRQRIDSRGHSTAVDAVGPGCLLTLEDTGSRCDYAATDTLICLMPRVRSDREHGAMANDVWLLYERSLRRVERIAQARSGRSAVARLASLLCVLADELGDRPRDRLPSALQQRDLARLIDMRHETLCRALGTLEKRGLAQRDPEGLVIVDRARLELAT